MKKIITILLTLIMIISSFTINVFAEPNSKEMRAVWITTVYNSDFPSTSTKGNAEAQKQELITKLDTLKEAGINTVILQVRPKGDALYQSNINPWSDVLTGTQGLYPGYDPLQFAIEEAHKRGMELHAWLNPYRVTTWGTDTSVLSANHPARLHPEWLIEYNSALYYNPDLTEVKEHIKATVAEIVQNYNVDGIHFDDYFYPANYPLPEGETRDGAVANARRQNVDEMVSMVYNTIKSIKPSVVFGISPTGIWKNNTSDPTGSATKGQECYYSVFSDVRSWIKSGTVDYIVPQIYWETGNSAADYETLVKWWSNEVSGTNIKLYIGQALYKDVVAAQIDTQLKINEKYPQVSGSFFFSAKDIFDNRQGCTDKITAYYNSSSSTNTTIPDNTVTETPNTTPDNNNTVVETPTTDEKPSIEIKTVTSLPTTDTVMVNGIPMIFESYNIDGYNYFKLRDIAVALNGTTSQFAVDWDEQKSAINITPSSKYEAVGNELKLGNGEAKTAVTSIDNLYINGKYVYLDTYKIEGNNFYKLRDLGSNIGFNVDWDESGIININSK